MIPQRINKATRELGKPVDWDDSKGVCGSLAIRDVQEAYGNRMISEWRPTAEDLAHLNAGGSVLLSIVGNVHPPVHISVEPAQ